jgi:Na+/H+ antiporter NhaD/arsenite permease-like protein
MRKVLSFFALILATLAGMYLARFIGIEFNAQQIASIGIFSMFIYGTLLFGEFRLAFAFGGIALLMACNLLTVERFTQSASLDVLVFLIGTFLVIGFLEESQFFEHVISGLVGAIGPRPQRLLLSLMIMSSISSALVGEVTAILFMAGAMLHLTSRYKLNPAPFIIMLVFASNVGSAMSSVGNPIGVLIALKTGLSFMDFLKWSAPVALVVDVVTFAICRWWFADSFRAFADAVNAEFARRQPVRRAAMAAVGAGGESGASGETSDLAEADNGGDGGGGDNPMSDTYFSPGPSNMLDGLDVQKTFRLCWVVLIGLVLLLVTHGLTERWLGRMFGAVREVLPNGQIVYGLKEGTMMVAAALIMGCIVLLIRRDKAREMVERRIDWWTLSFFMMLFASVGTLEDTHVTQKIALRLTGAGTSQMMTIQIVGWATGWLSAFLDNVLAVATFMPVVHDIRVSAGTPYPSTIYWFMLFGGTFMGNMTIIGSTANIVAVGMLEKRGHGTIRFGYWMKIGFIVSIASMIVATAMMMAMDKMIPGGVPRLHPPGIEQIHPAQG